MEGIRSFFLIFPISIAFKIELVSCRYLGVAANSSTRIQSNMLRCFMMKPEYSKLSGSTSHLPPKITQVVGIFSYISRPPHELFNNMQEMTPLIYNLRN